VLITNLNGEKTNVANQIGPAYAYTTIEETGASAEIA
jgi:hypothetical protein